MRPHPAWSAAAAALCAAGLSAAEPPAAGPAAPVTPPKSRADFKVPKPPSAQDVEKNLIRGVDKVSTLPNLIPNGDFEAGDLNPTAWQRTDGLCWHWVKDSDPAHGKVIKFDTDVYQSQAYGWWPKIALGQTTWKDAPKKIQPVGDKYDTIAGLDGAWYFSDAVPCKKGAAYWLTLDVKGPGMLVWLLGYPDPPDTSLGKDSAAFQQVLKEFKTGKPEDKGRGHEMVIHSYVWKGQLAVGGSDQWRTYSRRAQPFRPTSNTPKVKWLRVMLYPFWPPGEYAVDNVRLVEIDDNGVTAVPQPAKP